MIEVLVTLTLLATLAGVLTAVLLSAGKGNRILWARQQALAAVEAQLDCLSAGGEPLGAEVFERLWPDFEVSLDFVPGVGATDGLVCAEVTVAGRVQKKHISVTGRRYIPCREQR